MYPISVGLVVENSDVGDDLRRVLQDLSVRVLFELAEIPSDWSGFLERIDRIRPDVILLDVTRLQEPLQDVMARIRSTAAKPVVFALHTKADSDAILSALRAGAAEYLFPPFDEPLQAALERLGQSKDRSSSRGDSVGKLIAFVSAKGGCGATTLACHTAVELPHMLPGKYLLADLDLQAGLVEFLAKTKNPYSLADAVNNIQRLDQSYWKALVSNGIPDLEIVTAPSAPSAKQLSPAAIKQVLAFVRTQYDWSILDLGRNLNASTLSIMDLIDETYLVTTPEVPALHQAKRMIQFLLDGGYPRENLRLVLNRVPKRMEVTEEELGEMLGAPVYASIDDDYEELQDAFAEGRLVEPGTHFGRNITRLSRKISGTKEESKGWTFKLRLGR